MNIPKITDHSGNKYIRKIYSAVEPGSFVEADVYEVIDAFNVTCPAIAHAVKKLLCSGVRNKGTRLQDLEETLEALYRAVEKEKVKREINRYVISTIHDESTKTIIGYRISDSLKTVPNSAKDVMVKDGDVECARTTASKICDEMNAGAFKDIPREFNCIEKWQDDYSAREEESGIKYTVSQGVEKGCMPYLVCVGSRRIRGFMHKKDADDYANDLNHGFIKDEFARKGVETCQITPG